MPYDQDLVRPMKEELTRIGVKELLTAEQANSAMNEKSGTTLLVVNSVCGCAAGNARPGVEMALQHRILPDRSYSVFAGQDLEATTAARSFLHGYPPSSPAIALFREGELVMMLERKDIEGRSAVDVAQEMMIAFDKHCAPGPS